MGSSTANVEHSILHKPALLRTLSPLLLDYAKLFASK